MSQQLQSIGSEIWRYRHLGDWSRKEKSLFKYRYFKQSYILRETQSKCPAPPQHFSSGMQQGHPGMKHACLLTYVCKNFPQLRCVAKPPSQSTSSIMHEDAFFAVLTPAQRAGAGAPLAGAGHWSARRRY
eukprot:2013099-Pleurochrysis_carterae.AAC.1